MGFVMPAEWAAHKRSYMLWPTRPDVWREGARPAQQAFAAVAQAIARFEPVVMGVDPQDMAAARAMLDSPGITLTALPHDDAWVRDTGPSFTRHRAGERRAIDWRFNAWGGLYADWRQDEQVAARIAHFAGVISQPAPFVLEGGSIHVDGEGTCLVTEECLLNPNRNPGLSKDQISALLRDWLGVSTIIWLGRGTLFDETSGHVDNLAAFAAPGVVMLAGCEDRADPQWEISADAEARLRGARDARGRALHVVRLPMPGPLTLSADEAAGLVPVAGSKPRRAGDRLAGSYVNSYILNGAVVMPALDPRQDEKALDIVQRLFPGRTVLQLPGREILLGGGNIHCITQQEPA